MESRLIYESNKTFTNKVDWNRKKGSETEWIYFELTQINTHEDIIRECFDRDVLHVSLGRHNSFTENKNGMFDKIKALLGVASFKIWDEAFTKTIEVSNIGVYRIGVA